jgi:GTP-binding protein EngB required for normal cell division
VLDLNDPHLNDSDLSDRVQLNPLHRTDDSPEAAISGESLPGAAASGARRPGDLNDSQRRRLSITCEYIDKLLRDVEHILHSATSKSPFPRYLIDVNPSQARVIEDYIRRLRDQLLRTLDWQHMIPKPAEIPVTRAVLTNLSFIDIAIEELRPDYMKGSGAVPADAIGELNGVVHELRTIVNGMERYLRQSFGPNLEQRLQELERAGQDVALLQRIEQIVTRHGLVEFRQRIASLVSRLEDEALEVALFGRVSSGKSSLLNALLGDPILPVGVNPITAVPTQLRYGPALRAAVTYGDGRSEIVSVDEFAKLVTELGNPGNLRNVARALVEVPSPRLKQGIILVDTPGLGSLARKGAAETLAYLPQCDLALLLIDAGTSLNDEDLGTLRLLCESGIPTLVLLSKADLLSQEDLSRVSAYIQSQIEQELGLTLAVHAVSAMPNHSALLDTFFASELLPRFEQSRQLRTASTARKIGSLRESVTAALEMVVQRQQRGATSSRMDSRELESHLRRITGEIGELGTSLDHAILRFAETPDALIRKVAERALGRTNDSDHSGSLPEHLSEWMQDAVQEFLNTCVDRMRATGSRAIRTLEQIGRQTGRSEMPSEDELEALLREAPRFDLAARPDDPHIGRWQWLGEAASRALLQNSIRRSIGPLFKQQLHLYGYALSQWSRLTVEEIQVLVNSYAEADREQLHRMAGTGGAIADSPQIENDLAALRDSGGEEVTVVPKSA